MKITINKLVCFMLSAVLLFTAVTVYGAEVKNTKAENRKIFCNDEYIYEINDDETVSILYYTGEGLSVTVPAYIDSKPVISIEARAFYGTRIQTAVVSEGIRNIGNEAFFYCTELTNASLPSTLETTGTGVFRACTKLKNVWMHGNASLGKYMFYGCTSLSEIHLPDTAYCIPEGAFGYCASLRFVVMPSELVDICAYAFYGTGLISVTLPASAVYIFEKAFARCKDLISVYGNSEMEFVAEDAFEDCGMSSGGNYPSITPPSQVPTTPPSTGDNNTTDEFPPPSDPSSDSFVSEDGYMFGSAGEMEDYEYIYNEEVRPDFERSKQEILSLAWNVRTIGDANMDGQVNIKDATAIQKYIAGLTTEADLDFSYKNSDVDTDGKVTVKDATKIQKFIAGMLLSLC